MSHVITNHSLTIYEGSKIHFLRNESAKFARAVSAIKAGNINEAIEIITSNTIASDERMRFLPETNETQVLTESGWWTTPAELGKTIQKFLDKGLDFAPLVNFAINLSQNPSENSVKQLFSFLEKNDVAITDDGEFICWKAVKQDLWDIYTGETFHNTVGSVIKMDRSRVNDDPNVTCSRGAHVANWDYAAHHYGGSLSGKTMVYVSVNPKNVVSIPTDYNNAKMRVCEYKVLGISTQEIKGDVFTDGEFKTAEDIHQAHVSAPEYEKLV